VDIVVVAPEQNNKQKWESIFRKQGASFKKTCKTNLKGRERLE